jgi:hypothetical protein
VCVCVSETFQKKWLTPIDAGGLRCPREWPTETMGMGCG